MSRRISADGRGVLGVRGDGDEKEMKKQRETAERVERRGGAGSCSIRGGMTRCGSPRLRPHRARGRRTSAR